MRLRDSQRAKVYAWENREFDATAELTDGDDGCSIARIVKPPMLTLDECRKMLVRISRDYDIVMIDIGDGRGRRKACYEVGFPDTIKLPRWARKWWVVLHEAAHWIEWRMVKGKTASHGREFVGIYMELLRRYGGQDLSAMCRSANAAGIDFIPNSQATARYLKKHGLRSARR